MSPNELFCKAFKKIKLDSLIVQYLLGLAISILLIIILLNTNITYTNLQLPEGDYKDNLWKGSDVLTYVQPARNYINNDTFEYESYLSPFQRTIGYPLFLSILMRLFGDKWLIWTFFIQAVIFASIFPVLSKISYIIFPDKRSIAVASFIFFLIAGTFWTMTPVILTDLFFTTLFVAGICFGLLSIARQNWKYLILHLLFIGYAAQVRPTLMFYPVINIFILVAIAKKYNILSKVRVKKIIVISSIALLVICNIPSIRNYMIYGFFKPTPVLQYNLFNILGKNVLTERGEVNLYRAMEKDIEEIEDINEQLELKQKYAFSIYKRYPITTTKQMVKRAVVVIGESHFTLIANFWSYDWMDKTDPTWYLLKKSNFVIIINVIYSLIYTLIYISFVYFLIRLLKSKKYLFLFTIIIFISYLLFPSFIAGGGFRIRFPVEGIIVLLSFYEIDYHIRLLKDRKKVCNIRNCIIKK